MNQTPAARRITPLSVLAGLLFRPADTMWKLRDEGPIWLSLVSVWVLGGLGLTGALLPALAFGRDRSFWLLWVRGIAVLAAEFGVTMVLVHLSALLVWRFTPNPVMPAGVRTLLRLGGYWTLPSSLLSTAICVVLVLGIRSASGTLLRVAIAGIVVLAIAGCVWMVVFRLRMLRTVYLSTWGEAIAMGIILVLMGAAVRGVLNGILPTGAVSNGPLINVMSISRGPETDMATASVDWDLHLALGADPEIIRALESFPAANSTLGVTAMSRAPQPGDLVAYYRDRKAPHVYKGARLPKPIVIGYVLAGPGGEAVVEGFPLEQVPEGYALIRPVSDPRDPPHPSELVAIDSVAGQVPESHLRMQTMVTRLLLR